MNQMLSHTTHCEHDMQAGKTKYTTTSNLNKHKRTGDNTSTVFYSKAFILRAVQFYQKKRRIKAWKILECEVVEKDKKDINVIKSTDREYIFSTSDIQNSQKLYRYKFLY